MSFRRSFSPDEVLTLSDLDTWSNEFTWLAVLGHPIKHSLSPAMHNAALDTMARKDSRFAAWRYVRFDVPPKELPRALEKFHSLRFFGLNLTVPHKVIAFDCVHQVDAAAQPIGAVNTLRWTEKGWAGFNTDGYGLATAMRSELGVDLAGANIVLLGAGGAARGAAVECLQRGCASLWIANRTAERREELVRALQRWAPHCIVHEFDPGHPPATLPSQAWVINATSSGLHPEDTAPIDLAQLPAPAGVFDMIYNPAVTPLLARARALGLPSANGLSMLVHQGARSLQLWSNAEVPVDAMQRAVSARVAH